MSIENRQFGRFGAEIITNITKRNNKDYYVISFFEQSKIKTIVIKDAKGIEFTGNSLNGETFPAGYELYGKITSIELETGACIAYNDEPAS